MKDILFHLNITDYVGIYLHRLDGQVDKKWPRKSSLSRRHVGRAVDKIGQLQLQNKSQFGNVLICRKLLVFYDIFNTLTKHIQAT